MEIVGSIGIPHVTLALLFYLVCRLIRFVWQKYRFDQFKKAHATAEPRNLSGVWPLSLLDGWVRLRRILNMKKANEDLLDDIFGDDFKTTRTSQRTQFEGTNALLTVEPANIQAMLATQFKDFELGAMRINQFYPVLGSSIFTSDGR